MFKIIKKGSNNFWHVFNNGAKNVSISDFEVVLDDVLNTFVIVLRNGANIPQIALSVLDIIVIDETGSGVEETFLTASQLRARLVVLGYTAYLGAGNADSITGLISEGTNVTITGTGTLSDPYVISSTGGSGTTPTLQEVTDVGNETFHPIKLKANEGTPYVASVELGNENGSGFYWKFYNNYKLIHLNDSAGTDHYINWQDKNYDGVADITDITANNADALKRDGSNANSNVDLGNNSVLSKTLFVGEANKMNILADLLTDNRYARFQDKDYEGIADITDIPDVSNLVVKNTAITGATKTKITYDSKGLVTSGSDATTADIADSTNKRYVTDANLTTIGNTSGTNSGDETGSSIRTKLGITTLSGSNTGDQDLSNLVVKNTAITGATKTKITYDSKGLVTSGSDATTADIADSTNKRYQTDNQNSFNDATSSIQTQLNGKQALLSFTPYKFVQTSQTAHTGTTAETIVATATINGGTFNSNDVMKALFKATKGTTTSTVVMRLKINTSNSLSGATQIATFNFPSANTYMKLLRTFDLQGGNLYGYNFTSSIIDDAIATNTTGQSTTYNTANTLYLFFTVQLGTSSDSVTPNLVNITN